MSPVGVRRRRGGVVMVKRTRMTKWWWMVGTAALVLASAPAMADEEDTWTAGGKGAATALVNVLYIPAKLVYATTGGVVGGLAYCLTAGNEKVAETVWEPSVGGNYIMTTDQLFPKSYGGPVESETPPPEDRVAGTESQWPE